MTGIEWLYTGAAALVGYFVIIIIAVIMAIIGVITDKFTLPNWYYGAVKIFLFVLMFIFSTVFAYGMGDLVIQRFWS